MTRENTVNVPREPTEAMLDNAACYERVDALKRIWSAMLSAAPIHEGEGEDWSELERLARAGQAAHDKYRPSVGLPDWFTLKTLRAVQAFDEDERAFIAAANPATILKLIASARSAPPPSVEVSGEELDLYDDKVQEGISWTMRQWGEALGLTTWTQGDGSESVEGDVGAEIHTILVDAGLRCPETNAMATLAPSVEVERLREAGRAVCKRLLAFVCAVAEMTDSGPDVDAIVRFEKADAALSRKQEPGVPTPGGEG